MNSRPYIKKCISDTHPDLVKEWDMEKNGSLTPNDFTYGSHSKIIWKCKTCGYNWSAIIKNRTRLASGCPYCAGKRVNKDNCLAITHPDLSREWSVEKNADLTPLDVTHGNIKKVWWECVKCDHTWLASINNRTNHNSGCLNCLGKIVNKHNCLAIKYPKSIIAWHPTLNGNKTPYDFLPESNCIVWWKCSGCNYEWKGTINQRFKQDRGCVKCKIKSKGEHKILAWLKQNNIEYTVQQKFDDCRSPITNWKLAYDFYIPSRNILIEFDGKQHFEVGHFNGHKMTHNELLYSKLKDDVKTEYANTKNITLFRIKYTEMDKINELLTNAIIS